MKPYTLVVYGFTLVFAMLGIAILVRTAAAGGGVVGYVVGALFIVLGVARFSLERQRRH